MNRAQDKSPINAPALPEDGASIQGSGKDWGDVGFNGGASLEFPLPVSPARGFTPAMTLVYHSAAGNSPFGLGWTVPVNTISRRTSHGVPAYTADDRFIGPDGQLLLPDGPARLAPGTGYSVTRYQPRVERDFDRLERWQSATDPSGFWRVHAADGSQHLYGKTNAARIADPDQPHHIAQWLLQESLSARGEHIYYHYEPETETVRYPRDCRAQRYLAQVCYGHFTARVEERLYLLDTDDALSKGWHFQLLFDYGQRTTALDQVPAYATDTPWPLREDPFSSFADGFERRTLRLCRQVLLFHHFPAESQMGQAPVLVRRVVLEHHRVRNGLNLLHAIHEQAIDAQGVISSLPPQECLYQNAALKLEPARFQRLADFPGLNDGQRYHVVDLYGEGLPGLLYRSDKAWYYREPQRAEPGNADEVSYATAREIPAVPMADSAHHMHPQLADVTGNGRIDWIVGRPGLSGFFSLSAQLDWSGFIPFDALPMEYFHPDAVFGDLMGGGFNDLALVGPRSVRLYANRQQAGFAPGVDIPHTPADDTLPTLSHSPHEWVGFSDVLGSGQQHLVRIRHNQLMCWPNMGRGRFGKGFVMASLPFNPATFDATHIRLADLDGIGGADLLYLMPGELRVFSNLAGNRFDTTPQVVAWPDGVRHDALCQISLADLNGLGCPSLIVSVLYEHPRHWRYDFFDERPSLLIYTTNNLGAQAKVRYRSSAQEWLDEKKQRRAEGRHAVSQSPLAIPLVCRQTRHDDINNSTLTRHFSYRQAYYNATERAFQGFGLILQSETERAPGDAADSAGTLSKRWFHTGQALDMPTEGYSLHDPEAPRLGKTLLCQHSAPAQPQPTDHVDVPLPTPAAQTLRDAAYALKGALLRHEVFAADTAQGVPFSVQQHRYLVRQLAAASDSQPWARMLVVPVETVDYRYEQVPDDPVATHQLNLRWDGFGRLVHSVSVHLARRKAASDSPPAALADAYQQRWWRDSHDPAQQTHYLNETLAQWTHLTQDAQWRLGLPCRQRDNAWVVPKTELSVATIAYEQFIDKRSGPMGPQAPRALSGLSIQYYREPGLAGKTLEAGKATLQAFSDYLESAELNAEAIETYRQIPQMPGQAPWQLTAQLQQIGYRPMAVFFSANVAEPALWSVRRQWPRYLDGSGFYQLYSWRLTQGLGDTTLTYDPYGCHIIEVKHADGCISTTLPDYRLLLPISLTDPNGSVQQALYDGFGRLLSSRYQGQESGQTKGFGPMPDARQLLGTSVEQAINAPRQTLGQAASAHLYAPFSWMGTIATADSQAEWVTRGYLLPGGHIRETARLRLKKIPPGADASTRQLAALVAQARREPVHRLTLLADRYPDDPQQSVRLSLTFWDGFGRPLQRVHNTEPGDAWQVLGNGSLSFTRGAIQSVKADPRWCVEERVEYNHQGAMTRVYRPYFASAHRYISDGYLRDLAYNDRQFHDPLGRAVRTLTASGAIKRVSHHGWYALSEDENDTWEETAGAG
jgi:hypothetical protein